MLFHDACLDLAGHAVRPLELVNHWLQIIIKFDVFLDFFFELIDEQIVGRLTFKRESEYFFEHLPQVFWNQLEYLFGVLYV